MVRFPKTALMAGNCVLSMANVPTGTVIVLFAFCSNWTSMNLERAELGRIEELVPLDLPSYASGIRRVTANIWIAYPDETRDIYGGNDLIALVWLDL